MSAKITGAAVLATVMIAAVAASAGDGGAPKTKARAWSVGVVQKSQLVQPQAASILKLDKAPWTLRVTVDGPPQTVQLSVTTNKAVASQLVAGFDPDQCYKDPDKAPLPFCPGTGMAEGKRDASYRLFLDDVGHHYLYYKSPSEHRWSRVTQTSKGQTVFERDVVGLGVDTIPMAKWSGKTIYLTVLISLDDDPVVSKAEIKQFELRFDEK